MTRKSLAALSRWRQADTPQERASLQQLCSLHPDEAAGLDQLCANLARLGPVLVREEAGKYRRGWFDLDHARVHPCVLDQLLAGVDLPEQAVHSLIQGLGLGSLVRGDWLEAALSRRLGPTWEARKREYAREQSERETRRLHERRTELIHCLRAVVELKRAGAARKETEMMAVEKTGTVAERLRAALDRRGLDFREIVPTALHAELARECDTTTNNIGFTLSQLRKAAGVSRSRVKADQNGHVPPEEAVGSRQDAGELRAPNAACPENIGEHRAPNAEPEGPLPIRSAKDEGEKTNGQGSSFPLPPSSFGSAAATAEEVAALRAERDALGELVRVANGALISATRRVEGVPRLPAAERPLVLSLAHQLAGGGVVCLDLSGVPWERRRVILLRAAAVLKQELEDESLSSPLS